MSNTENQNNLDPREWKTFNEWQLENKVVMKGQKGTFKDGVYYFHRTQVTNINKRPDNWSAFCHYYNEYEDSDWFNTDEWMSFDPAFDIPLDERE